MALHAPFDPVESFIPTAAAHGVFQGADAARELQIFTPPLCFVPFHTASGNRICTCFSMFRPDSRVRGIGTDEVLMVGENEPGDLAPARKFGWRTWQIRNQPGERGDGGDWLALGKTLGLTAAASK